MSPPSASGSVSSCRRRFASWCWMTIGGSSIRDKSVNSGGACLRKLARLPGGPQARNRAAHRGTHAATASAWSAHAGRNRRTYRLWASLVAAPRSGRASGRTNAAAPVGGCQRPTAHCRRDCAGAGTNLAVHHRLSDARITHRRYPRGAGTEPADDLGSPRPRPAPRRGTIAAVGCLWPAWG